MKLIIAGAKAGVFVGSAYVVFTIISGIWVSILHALKGKKKENESEEKE